MTRAEAEARLSAAFPGKTIFLRCQRAMFNHRDPKEWRTSEYVVSVLPGQGDSECEQWAAKTLEEAVEKALGLHPVTDADSERLAADLFFHPELVRCDVCNGMFQPDQIGQSTAETVLCQGCLKVAAGNGVSQ